MPTSPSKSLPVGRCTSSTSSARPAKPGLLLIIAGFRAGTVLNYFADSGLNKATILFPGVACFALAVVAGATTHIFNEQYLGRRKALLEASHHGHAVGNAVVGFEHGSGELQLGHCM